MNMVNVTQEDIDNGLVGEATGCAIARAVNKHLSVKDEASVTGNAVFEVGGDKYLLPKKGQMFVKRFDADKKSVKPFSFALRKYKPKELIHR